MPIEYEGFNARARRRLKLCGIVAACVAGLIVISGAIARQHAAMQTKIFTDQLSTGNVDVVTPAYSSGSPTLKLPGQLQAFYSASIYARVPGYVRAWYKDIGAHVHKGDILAVIDTPELDQQIAQAKAGLANAVAAEELSRTTAARWSALLKLDAVSSQETEEKISDLTAKTDQVAAAQANVHRLSALKSFARITAPFDGTVTNRSIDVGALVNAGAESPGSALFTVVDAHKIRVYVRVPQSYSANIHAGMTADLRLPEYPDRTFPATLDSTADAISEQSNSLLVQLLADNARGALKPGEYAKVTLHLPSGSNMLRIPASTLMFRRRGLEVATVLPNNRILMKAITIGLDLGPQVEVSEGLNPHDRVVDNPPDSLEGGDLVHVLTPSS